MTTRNVVVLISGRGSNLEALLKTAADDGWTQRLGARVAAVISNQAEAPGLAIARKWGIPWHVVSHTDYGSREAFDQALARTIQRYPPALIVLAGFMRVLTAGFVRAYADRLINIHPSLLPLFPGLQTHKQALAAGVRVHGATVHFVSPDIDSGPIIAQAVIGVRPDDDEDTLATRVLAQEHLLLPRAARLVLEGRARCENARVVVRDVDPSELTLFAP
jgi:phosphoribosylglycinamide formyltransferase-1